MYNLPASCILSFHLLAHSLSCYTTEYNTSTLQTLLSLKSCSLNLSHMLYPFLQGWFPPFLPTPHQSLAHRLDPFLFLGVEVDSIFSYLQMVHCLLGAKAVSIRITE